MWLFLLQLWLLLLLFLLQLLSLLRWFLLLLLREVTTLRSVCQRNIRKRKTDAACPYGADGICSDGVDAACPDGIEAKFDIVDDAYERRGDCIRRTRRT